MLNRQLGNVENLHGDYSLGQPFPHLVIDNFLQQEVVSKLLEELQSQDVAGWEHDPHSEQVNKWSMSNLQNLQSVTAETLRWFNSREALGFFEKLTGIRGLMADPQYLGGGVHITSRGGRLGIHSDFNIHPNFKIHRRLNALLFLNDGWDPQWNGQLQLWSSDMRQCVKSIDPISNRLVIFNVNDTSYHGVPDVILCPENKRRISLALYYYTLDRPEHEKSDFHLALWQKPNLE